MTRFVTTVVVLVVAFSTSLSGADASLRLATFDVDATPPIGSPVAYAPARSIVDPLHAKGIVLLPGDAKPIVLCAFDWLGIANGGQDWWRQTLAVAAGTTPQRVAVHTVHQHDGIRCDTSAMALLARSGHAEAHFDAAFLERLRARMIEAVRIAILDAHPVTHIGTGQAKVEKVASNRRLLGLDGKVAKMRFSACRDAASIAAPEGVIDPYVRLVSFWQGNEALVCLAYYATHPMSYYGKGDVSADFVGMARREREKRSGVPHVYFTGAGGNVAAGKYNNGQPEVRPILARRLAAGMAQAWEQTTRVGISADVVRWMTVPVELPVASHLAAKQLEETLSAKDTAAQDRLAAAVNLAWLQRCQAGQKIEVGCLRLPGVRILHMPGELFVEYALRAQEMCPQEFVCLAAYGDYGPGYIGTEIAYEQGGYETSQRASRVAPQVEQVLTDAMRKLLK